MFLPQPRKPPSRRPTLPANQKLRVLLRPLRKPPPHRLKLPISPKLRRKSKGRRRTRRFRRHQMRRRRTVRALTIARSRQSKAKLRPQRLRTSPSLRSPRHQPTGVASSTAKKLKRLPRMKKRLSRLPPIPRRPHLPLQTLPKRMKPPRPRQTARRNLLRISLPPQPTGRRRKTLLRRLKKPRKKRSWPTPAALKLSSRRRKLP